MAFLRGELFSNELNMMTGVNIIIPEFANNSELNVLYLLHGLSDNCSGWTRLTSIERYAIKHNIAVIMPEVQRSFYTDMQKGLKYYSYVSSELKNFAKTMFNLPTSKDKNYIAGLSMGGYGTMKIAFSKPEDYTACAAFSAVCDLQDMINSDMPATRINELKAIFGDELKITDSLYSLTSENNTSKPRVFMTCGTDDLLYQQNIKLKNHLLATGYDLTYHEWKADHTWDFWDKSVEMALEFFFGAPTSDIKTPLYKND